MKDMVLTKTELQFRQTNHLPAPQLRFISFAFVLYILSRTASSIRPIPLYQLS